MTMPQPNVGVQTGAASFGVGVDLRQFERDLDAAERLARSRAGRIQSSLGSIPISGAPSVAAQPTRAVATAQRVAAAPSQQTSQAVPPWVDQLYNQAVGSGADPIDVIDSLRRAGLPPGALRALRARVPRQVTATQAARTVQGQMRQAQQRAQRDARLAGAPFSVISTGRQVGGTQTQDGSSGSFLSSLIPTTAAGFLRVGAAAAGIGLGLNVAAGVALKFHEELAKAVNDAIALEQASRRIGVAFGTRAGSFTGPGAAAFLADPLTRGTQADYQAFVTRLGPLSQQFGLSDTQINQVAVDSGRLARIWGVDLQSAGNVLEQVLRGNLQAGEQLNLVLTDQYGAIRGIGLTYQELAAAIGPAAASEKVLAVAQQEANRQFLNNAQNADSTVQAFDRLAKASEVLKSRIADLAKQPVGVAATAAAGGVEAVTNDPLDAARSVLKAAAVFAATPLLGPLAIPLFAGAAIQGRRQQQEQIAQAQAVEAATSQQFQNEAVGATIIERAATGAPRFGPPSPTPDQQRDAIELQQRKASIQAAAAQAQLDSLSADSDLRRLSVQDQINDVAKQRIGIEQQLTPILLEQQRVQDQITLATRENLDLRERLLRAQISALGPNAAAADLSFNQQKVRLQAQAQQAAAIQGRGTVAGLPSIPDLMTQAMNLALSAPQIGLGALEAGHAVDVAQRTQQADQLSKQLATVPAQQTLEGLQPATLFLQQADAANQALERAVQASLDLANISYSPAVIQAERDLAAARKTQADAAARIAQLQGEQGGFNLNASANVVVQGVTDVQAMVNNVMDALEPQIYAAFLAARNNPYGPSGPPGDRAGR